MLGGYMDRQPLQEEGNIVVRWRRTLGRCGAARGAAAAQALNVSNGHSITGRVCSVVEHTRFDGRDGHRRGVLLVEKAHVVVEQA